MVSVTDCFYHFIKGTAMQTEKAQINDGLHASKVSWKFRKTISHFTVIYPRSLLFSEKVAYFLTVSIVLSVYKPNFTAK